MITVMYKNLSKLKVSLWLAKNCSKSKISYTSINLIYQKLFNHNSYWSNNNHIVTHRPKMCTTGPEYSGSHRPIVASEKWCHRPILNSATDPKLLDRILFKQRHNVHFLLTKSTILYMELKGNLVLHHIMIYHSD